MDTKNDELWIRLGDTQPIPVITGTYRDESGWWETYGDNPPVPPR